MGCRDSLVVIERWVDGEWSGVHWWPTPGSGSLDPSVPVAVASAYDEGMRALAIAAPRAAVVMFRGALAEIVGDKGSATAQAKGTLYEQLKVMDTDGTLHPSLVDWAKEIRVLGNVGAHPSSLGTVTVADASDLGHLVAQMINVLYETPARIARTRAARTASP